MPIHLRVYVFNDISKYLLNNIVIIKNIESVLDISIKYVKKNPNSYFLIEGKKYDTAHKARIIIQDIEKELYRDSFYNFDYNTNNNTQIVPKLSLPPPSILLSKSSYYKSKNDNKN